VRIDVSVLHNPDYVKQFTLCNPNSTSTDAEAIYFGRASILAHVVQHFGL